MMTVGSSADQGSVYLDAWSIAKWEADYSDLEKRIIAKTLRAFEELKIDLPQIGKLDVSANAVTYDTKKAMMAMVKNDCIDCILVIHDDDTLHDVKAQIYAAYKKTMISAEYLRKKFALFQKDDRIINLIRSALEKALAIKKISHFSIESILWNTPNEEIEPDLILIRYKNHQNVNDSGLWVFGFPKKNRDELTEKDLIDWFIEYFKGNGDLS